MLSRIPAVTGGSDGDPISDDVQAGVGHLGDLALLVEDYPEVVAVAGGLISDVPAVLVVGDSLRPGRHDVVGQTAPRAHAAAHSFAAAKDRRGGAGQDSNLALPLPGRQVSGRPFAEVGQGLDIAVAVELVGLQQLQYAQFELV